MWVDVDTFILLMFCNISLIFYDERRNSTETLVTMMLMPRSINFISFIPLVAVVVENKMEREMERERETRIVIFIISHLHQPKLYHFNHHREMIFI